MKTFEEKIHELFSEFHKDFSSWVEDFEHVTDQRHVAASLSDRFVLRRAKDIMSAYDNLLGGYREEFWRIMAMDTSLTTVEKKKVIEKEKNLFRQTFAVDVGKMRAKATVFLEDITAKSINLPSDIQLKMASICDTDYLTLMENFRKD